MAAKRQRGGTATERDDTFASQLEARMADGRVGVMELSRASGLSKETISRLIRGRNQPTPATLRKLDAGFAELEALQAAQAPVGAVVVTREEFDLFRQRVGHASSVAGRNAQAIAEGHEKLDRIEGTLADLMDLVQAGRNELAALRRDLAAARPVPSEPVSDTDL